MKSVAKRFSELGVSNEKALEIAREQGKSPLMDIANIKSVEAIDTYLERLSPGEVFEYFKPEIADYSSPDAFEKLVHSIRMEIEKVHSEKEELRLENASIQRENKKLKALLWNRRKQTVLGLLENCKES